MKVVCDYKPIKLSPEKIKYAAPGNDNFYCKKCNEDFVTLIEMKEHFRHHSAPTENIEKECYNNSISPYATKSNGKLKFVFDGQLCDVWSCFIKDGYKSDELTESIIFECLSYMAGKNICVVHFRAGKFAAGIYNLNGEEIATKAFRRYTVRAGQGFSQSKAGGSKGFHSAGSQVRHENEMKLIEEIYELFKNWKQLLMSCSFIIGNSSPCMDSILFGQNSPILSQKCLFTCIPFETYQPSHDELSRIAKRLFFE